MCSVMQVLRGCLRVCGSCSEVEPLLWKDLKGGITEDCSEIAGSCRHDFPWASW